MLTVAYLANQFPVAVEPYVTEEIEALRRLGVRVITGSVARASTPNAARAAIVLRPAQVTILMRALWLCVWRWRGISKLVARILFRGREGPIRRGKALLHTVIGACYAVRLAGQAVDHIHAHHGFSSSWIAMVAARLLGIDFSMTLHGSDLLLHRAYLDLKLQSCRFCFTISEYNRRFITIHYPEIDPAKVVVARLGVEVSETEVPAFRTRVERPGPFRMLAVGRLHVVKDHAFLIRACAQLQAQGLDFHCNIAGDGPERHRLESLIREVGVEKRVTLLGHALSEQTDSLYKQADLVVLTSRSEGIPLVLMEAMARGKLVLAPAITGIPELVLAGKTGFQYESGSMIDFVRRVGEIFSLVSETWARPVDACQKAGSDDRLSLVQRCSTNRLNWIRHAARLHVFHNFNRKKNLKSFTNLFLQRIFPIQSKDLPHASSVLQQIQLSFQRNRGIPVRVDGTDAVEWP